MFSGSLEEQSPFDVLRSLAVSGHTGRLRLAGEVDGSFYLREGALYFAELDSVPAIEDVLLGAGVAADEWDDALEAGQEEHRVAESLVVGLAVSPVQLRALMRDHLTRVLERVFSARSGHYEFDEGEGHWFGHYESFTVEAMLDEVTSRNGDRPSQAAPPDRAEVPPERAGRPPEAEDGLQEADEGLPEADEDPPDDADAPRQSSIELATGPRRLRLDRARRGRWKARFNVKPSVGGLAEEEQVPEPAPDTDEAAPVAEAPPAQAADAASVEADVAAAVEALAADMVQPPAVEEVAAVAEALAADVGEQGATEEVPAAAAEAIVPREAGEEAVATAGAGSVPEEDLAAAVEALAVPAVGAPAAAEPAAVEPGVAQEVEAAVEALAAAEELAAGEAVAAKSAAAEVLTAESLEPAGVAEPGAAVTASQAPAPEEAAVEAPAATEDETAADEAVASEPAAVAVAAENVGAEAPAPSDQLEAADPEEGEGREAGADQRLSGEPEAAGEEAETASEDDAAETPSNDPATRERVAALFRALGDIGGRGS